MRYMIFHKQTETRFSPDWDYTDRGACFAIE
jgi:hypothetical protein